MKPVKHRIAFLILSILPLTFLAGCSDVAFESLPKLSCSDIGRDQESDCVNNPKTVTVSFTFGVGEVDILFVNDNSGSMFVEQRKMAEAFPNFLSRISNLFYQIAVITTDVSASPGNSAKRAANGNGEFQDGKLLEFTNQSGNKSGLKFIDQDTPNALELFKGTIQRKESIACDEAGFAAENCPSGDERAIFAANLAIERGHKKFFRSGAHLALVILSDENERSHGGLVQPGISTPTALEVKDLPETLVSTFERLYPTKSIAVHSVVTNNESCRANQYQISPFGGAPTLGFIGTHYMRLSLPDSALLSLGNLLPGTVGSICASDYGAQLGQIGTNVVNNTLDSPKQLVCELDPETVNIVTEPTGFESQIEVIVDEKNRITFDNLPLGVKVKFSYDCPRF